MVLRLQLVQDLVPLVQHLPVVRGLRADEDVVVVEALLEVDEAVDVLVGAGEQVVGLFLGNLKGDN